MKLWLYAFLLTMAILGGFAGLIWLATILPYWVFLIAGGVGTIAVMTVGFHSVMKG